MGVHYLFPWIQEMCPESISTSREKSGTVLLFDVNAMLYSNKTDPKEACLAVMNVVEEKIKQSNCTTAVLAVDGVAPKAKRWQQRKRRFLNPENNYVSVGTDFMNRLDREFVNILQTRVFCTTIYFSGSNVPGEGEHKIMKFIKKFKWNGPKYIFGVDGDLILLSLLSAEKDIYIVRPVFRKSGMENVVNINILKNYIEQRFANCQSFVALASVLGNDFLPSIEPFDTKDSFEMFLKTVQHIKLVDRHYFIDWKALPERDEPTVEGTTYAIGMQWILNYYTQKEGSEYADWYYPFNERPKWECVQQVGAFLLPNTPLAERSCNFQLFYILPEVSRFLLPDILQLVHAESFSVSIKKRKKRPSWDVDYIIEENGINLERLFKLVEFFLKEESGGGVLKFQIGPKQALKPSESVKHV